MAKTNVKRTPAPAPVNHHGIKGPRQTAEQQLRRSVLATMLFEDTFYEDGEEIYARIKRLAHAVPPQVLADLAVEARTSFNLRHVSLVLARELARHPQAGAVRGLVASTIANTIQRADEIAEFVAIYWRDKKQPLSKQVKKGLSLSFLKFNEFQLAKYNRDAAVRLRDVLFLIHAKPDTKAREKLWKKLVENKLATPDTWETELSAGKDKKATFERLIGEKKLGALALLRNLRNMTQSGVERKLVTGALMAADYSRVLPFRFLAAARHAPEFESLLDDAMQDQLKALPRLPGKTFILVDVSGSMDGTKVSAKSELDRRDAAAALAAMAAGVCEDFSVAVFTTTPTDLPQRKGMALISSIKAAPAGGTNIGVAVAHANKKGYDRLIVITDEQSHDRVGGPLKGTKSYMINVAPFQNGVGNEGDWVKLNGFSESVLKWIAATEQND
jgi:60 kDa SS-A/Ro ribonucleoprotein